MLSTLVRSLKKKMRTTTREVGREEYFIYFFKSFFNVYF